MKWMFWITVSLMLMALLAPPVFAGVGSYAVRETTEYVMKKFGREATEIGTEALTRKIGGLAGRYGDDALRAFQKVGPKVSRLADDAVDPALAVRLLAKHGDDAVRLVARPQQLKYVAQFGDDAAEALLKHGDAIEPLLQTCGSSASHAMKGLSKQSGRRAAIMLADGELTKLGRADELLGVMSRYGDAGANFIWQNKGTLAVGATLTAFLASPETFIEGGTTLASIAADAVVKPVVTSAAQTFPWMLFAGFTGLAGLIAYWIWCVPRTVKLMLLRALAKVAGRIRLS